MKCKLIIVGAGGFGREVYSWAKDVEPSARDWEIYGFLDDRTDALAGYHLPCSVIGSPTSHQPKSDERFVVAIGDVKTRRELVHVLSGRGARFTNIIHPSSVIGVNNQIGTGCVFCPHSTITSGTTVGNHVIFNIYSSVGHDAIIGDFCSLSGYATVTGYAELGDAVMMGTHSTVLPSCRVGADAVVGAGSVVMRDVKSGTTVFGTPAKKIF